VSESVQATRAALEVIDRLGAAHGPLMFIQSGGCCDGSSPICLAEGELPLGPNDVRLGEIGGAAFYIDAALYESWGRPQLTVEVSPGATDSFSLEGPDGIHFVTLTGSCPTP
jgi:uncharacterized protein